MTDAPYSTLDREIITLAAVWDLIGSMVHYGHFVKNHRLENASLMFNTNECSKLFLIVLADFLSLPRDGTLEFVRLNADGALGKTYLGHLQRVALEPTFAGDQTLLANSITAFAEWLDGYAVVEKVWLPSIEREGPIRVQRLTYLKICGTASKHGFTRLGEIVKQIQKVLFENGTTIDEGQGYLVIPDFQEWFRDNIFLASSTLIAWHLNEIRWGIYQYLLQEFRRAYRPTVKVGGVQMYTYNVPQEITHPLVRSIYWDLMNDMRRQPYFPRFTVDQFIRDRH